MYVFFIGFNVPAGPTPSQPAGFSVPQMPSPSQDPRPPAPSPRVSAPQPSAFNIPPEEPEDGKPSMKTSSGTCFCHEI